ncbi:hypothetical protein LX73_2511 [Fodinibius salinus]|uniref:Uncharacterized protein n=1 Tax=Fodinibius salinus TaxID=860790 RepID=A0A5D3YJ73_9BACT|nr:hypothetical protein [Fodinibius salinus]TYP91687.1 hypothetical protein LX73_2511 [Fodinibius salinus]
MDIFKLFFNHDQRLDKLAKRNANKTQEEIEASLDDFMEPDLTYSKFYITGTRLKDEQFGLSTLSKYETVIEQLNRAFEDHTIYTNSGSKPSLNQAIETIAIGEVLVISKSRNQEYNFDTLEIDEESNVGHKKETLSKVLKSGAFVIYKEQAHHGFDLHLFSMENIYPDLFEVLQPLVQEDFRFFSINSKRMGSERHFYFETWTLKNPPHGAEEVFQETVL